MCSIPGYKESPEYLLLFLRFLTHRFINSSKDMPFLFDASNAYGP